MSLSILIIERRFTAFDVFLNGEHIDTTFHTGDTVASQRASLINHDGYSSDIEVFGKADSVLPLTKTEKKQLLDDADVTVWRNGVTWSWRTSGSESVGFTTEDEAINDAIDTLELDTKGAEDTE